MTALPQSVARIAAESGTLIRLVDPESGEGRAVLEFLHDADRAMRYLGFPDWEIALVECSDGVFGLAHLAGGARSAIVTAAAGRPLGSVQRVTRRVRDEMEAE